MSFFFPEDRLFTHPNSSESTPIVCLHGFAGTPADWEPALTAAKLSGQALCLPGHGPSCPAPTDFSAAAHQLLARWPSVPAAVVGYSLGGRLGLAISALAPEKVSQLVLVAAHTGLSSSQERIERIQLDEHRAHCLLTNAQDFFDKWDQLPMFQGPTTPHLTPWIVRRRQLSPEQLSQTMKALSLGSMPTYRERVFGTNLGCTLIAGAQDQRCVTHYQSIFRLYPRVRMKVIKSAAHRVLIDTPASLGAILRKLLTSPLPAGD